MKRVESWDTHFSEEKNYNGILILNNLWIRTLIGLKCII